ncbi:MAG: YjcQ family protein [Lachnospiraceae bacterium]|nr:YjcQ family protein [Lachnospiraceae bacterium]
MVELIVSFALLGIFLIGASTIISYSFREYYAKQRLMTAFTVADTVLAEVKNDIRTMQPSSSVAGHSGYIKIRDKDGTGIAAADGIEISGEGIEFLPSNASDGAFMVQLDTRGLPEGTVIVKSGKITNEEPAALPAGCLTYRYYSKYAPETQPAYQNAYADVIDIASDFGMLFSTRNGTLVERGAEEHFSKEFYNGYEVRLEFTVKPVKVTVDDGSGPEDKLLVKTVKTVVTVLKADEDDDPDNNEIVYITRETVDIQNDVYYRNDNTLYSEM